MDQGPVTPSASPPAASLPPPSPTSSWKLAPDIAALTQGLIVSGFSDLPTGRALLLTIADPTTPDQGSGAWLRTLNRVAPVTSATPPESKGGQQRATALAFTSAGLAKLGLTDTTLASFLAPFREGMVQEDRLRRLGDRRSGQWLDTVIPGGPAWSGKTAVKPQAAKLVKAYEVVRTLALDVIETPLTVHAILLLYTPDDKTADDWTGEVTTALLPHGVTVVRSLGLDLSVEKAGYSREHFGFADGLSQPTPYDVHGAVLQNGTAVVTPDPVQGVPLGEVMLGYLNGHQEVAPGPVVPGDLAGNPDPRPADAGLLPHPQAQGFYDFGQNGSYMVVRELRQDVAAFWQSMDENAAAISKADPANSEHITADWLAERVFGRNKDGNLLCPGGQYMAPDPLGAPATDFLFLARDGQGLGCPLGAHLRRANPRDTLAPSLDQGPTLLAAANNHRILRRGRKYGPKIADPRKDDRVDRGLLFMALNTDIARQFEFVQQTWLLNANFATLYQEVDPLVGPAGRMTVPEDPLRRTLQVKTFIKLAGGDYFFLPSLPALRYLALL